jgi:hypothetical protein
MTSCVGLCKLDEKKVCTGCNRTIEEIKKLMKKTLEKNSKYNDYDLDGDGTVTDAELENAKAIKATEDELRKHLAQLRMARYTLIAMGVFTFAMFIIDLERVKALSDISNLFYLSGAGIVGAYMGTTAWMNKK